MQTLNDLERVVRAAGWVHGAFGKWWNPTKDSGARYPIENPRALRHICEDHGINPKAEG
jgi:hypothetical protein